MFYDPTSASKVSLLAALAIVFSTLGACVYAPSNGDWVNPSAIDFGGYAQHPGATIQVQAYDQSTSVWRIVTTAVSSTSVTRFGGDELYSWSIDDFNFTAVPNWECYWGYNGYCAIPASRALAKLRFKEVGSDLGYLVTFEADGIQCVVDRVAAGQSWLVAGYNCRSPVSPVLTLFWLT